MPLKLVDPCLELRDAFLRAVDDYVVADPVRAKNYADAQTDFLGYIKMIQDQAAGRNLPDGYVPQTFYWLVTDQGEIGGISRVRHRLNKHLETEGGHIGYDVPPSQRQKGYATELLRLILPKARALGLTRVLLTCDADNLPSAKVIIKNGGQEDAPFAQKRRFWIEL